MDRVTNKTNKQMKKINILSKLLLILSSIIIITSCDKSDDWKPGPQVSADNPGVFFSSTTPRIIEVGASSTGELKKDYFTITMGRDEFKASAALSVPIIIKNAPTNMSVDETVKFEAGATTAQLKIKISSFEFSTPYTISLEIDENYSNPYKSYGQGETGGSTKVDALIEVVSLLGEATFTPTDFSKAPATTFYPFVHKIYDNMDGTYTIKNFLYNNAGHNLDFELDESGNIKVAEDLGYHEKGTGSSARWNFYSGPSSSSSNYIPCYVPTEDPKELIRYIYFYTDPGYSYYNFNLDLEKKTGKMTGYARYELTSSGRVTFIISWN